MLRLLWEYGLTAWYSLAGAGLVFCAVAWWLEVRRERRGDSPW